MKLYILLSRFKVHHVGTDLPLIYEYLEKL